MWSCRPSGPSAPRVGNADNNLGAQRCDALRHAPRYVVARRAMRHTFLHTRRTVGRSCALARYVSDPRAQGSRMERRRSTSWRGKRHQARTHRPRRDPCPPARRARRTPTPPRTAVSSRHTGRMLRHRQRRHVRSGSGHSRSHAGVIRGIKNIFGKGDKACCLDEARELRVGDRRLVHPEIADESPSNRLLTLVEANASHQKLAAANQLHAGKLSCLHASAVRLLQLGQGFTCLQPSS